MSRERAFVDTNLFLRYLTNDVPKQADAVEALLQRACDGELSLVTNSLVTNSLVIAELVWTLESFYQVAHAEIQAKVQAILNMPGLEVSDGDLILRAIVWYAEKNVDFIDAYNAAWITEQAIPIAYTFDRKHFARLPGMTARVPGQAVE